MLSQRVCVCDNVYVTVCQPDCFVPLVVVHHCVLVVMMGSVPPGLPPSRTYT